MLGSGLGGGVHGGADHGLNVLGDLVSHIVLLHGGGNSLNGSGGSVVFLDPVQSLNAAAQLILQLIDLGGGNLAGLFQTGVLSSQLGIAHGNGRSGGSLNAGTLQHLGTLGFCLSNHLVAGLLCVGDSFLHGSLVLAVFFQFADQNTHLALQQSIFLIQSDIVFGQRLQELIHLLHIVAAEGSLGEGNLIDLLRCKHKICSPFEILN